MELIVNVSENWAIGRENELLFTISADLRRFRQLTMGKTVILGRKTLATFPGGRPLRGRRNLVLSANPAYEAPGAEVVHSLDELRQALAPGEEAAVIGGERVYRLLLPYCSRARITKTMKTVPADRFFPDLDALPNWRLAENSKLLEEDGVRFQYCDYENLEPLPL